MEQINWAPEHSAALREYLARGMSFSEIADAINIKFKTAYSRNAAIGRAKRLGLAGPARQQTPPRARPLLERLRKSRPAKSGGRNSTGRSRRSKGLNQPGCDASRSSRAIFR